MLVERPKVIWGSRVVVDLWLPVEVNLIDSALALDRTGRHLRHPTLLDVAINAYPRYYQHKLETKSEDLADKEIMADLKGSLGGALRKLHWFIDNPDATTQKTHPFLYSAARQLMQPFWINKGIEEVIRYGFRQDQKLEDDYWSWVIANPHDRTAIGAAARRTNELVEQLLRIVRVAEFGEVRSSEGTRLNPSEIQLISAVVMGKGQVACQKLGLTKVESVRVWQSIEKMYRLTQGARLENPDIARSAYQKLLAVSEDPLLGAMSNYSSPDAITIIEVVKDKPDIVEKLFETKAI